VGPTAVLEVQLLGRPGLRWAGAPVEGLRRKGLALVCYLAHLGRPAPRTALATLLWGEGRLSNLRQELAALRKAPAPSCGCRSTRAGWR
jgi:DNA-binding SARP family transcriptional activator